LQAHLSRYTIDRLPIADYVTDTKTVLDQAIRILQAMIDFSAASVNRISLTRRCITLMQCVKSAMWWSSDYQSQHQKQDISKRPGQRQQHSVHSCALRLLDSSNSGSLGAKSLDDWSFVRPSVSDDWKVRMEVGLQCGKSSGRDGFAKLPYLQKPQPEGWIALVSEQQSGRLVCLKRLTADARPSNGPLQFSMDLDLQTDMKIGQELMLELTVLSDCYFETEPATKRITIYS
jgi:hypothetical protein